ncbi:hypothetical protein TSMEX_007070 [Taenia solium]|eukprot:TsM_001129500 transcript=TsM_001129500 gene=TsM_001129500
MDEPPKQENVALDVPSGSSQDETDDERRLIQALATNPEDEMNFLADIKRMLTNNDSRLNYIFDGDAIVNPLIADQETQLGCLMDLFCEKKAESGYKCTACGEEHVYLDEMHQHLLRHSKCKFYICVHCLEGCNTLLDMVYHRKTHVGDDIELPASIQEFLEKLRSSEGLEPPKSSTPEESEGCPPEKRRRIEHHCNVCGLTFDRLDVVLLHTEQEHPTERDVIDRLRLRLVRAALDPSADEEGDASNPIS